MTNKIITAFLAYLSNEIADIDIVDSETHADTINPCIVVKINNVENFSRSLFNSYVINIEISYKNHPEDYTEAEQLEIIEEIQTAILDNAALKTQINSIVEDGVYIDHVQFADFAPSWDEQTYNATFNGVIVAQKA